MITTAKRTLLVVPALLALMSAAVTVAQPSAAARSDAADAEQVLACDGGVQQRALFRSNDQPTTIGESVNAVPLPGAVIAFVVPANQTRQVLVTFAASGFLSGAPLDVTQPVDSLRVTVLLDGVPIPPADDVTFNTDAGQYNALEGCKRVGEGAHSLTVQWRVDDAVPLGNLTGTLPAWSLHAEINA